MPNMFEEYATDRKPKQQKIEKTVSADTPAADEKRTTPLAIPDGERQEGTQDDGG